MSQENINLLDYRIVRCPKSFCPCGARLILLMFNDLAQIMGKSYYLCPRCQRVAKLGVGELRPGETDVPRIEMGHADEYEQEIREGDK